MGRNTRRLERHSGIEIDAKDGVEEAVCPPSIFQASGSACHQHRPRIESRPRRAAEQDLRDPRQGAHDNAELPCAVVGPKGIVNQASAPGTDDRSHLMDHERNAEDRCHVTGAEQFGDVTGYQRDDTEP